METISMKKLREVLRLKFVSQLTHRQIANALNISAGTVSHYARAMQDANISWEVADKLCDDELNHKLLPYYQHRVITPKKHSYPEPDYLTIYQSLKHKGVNLQLLWEEYKQVHEDKKYYSYSQFCRLYTHWSKQIDPSLKQIYKAGEKSFIDYCGPKIPIYNLKGEILFKAYVFVSVLGASQYIYAEATKTRSLPDWIGSHIRMFHFYGGVTEILVPDNEKSAVTSASYYEPDINLAYADLAQHYETAVIPTRPGKPKDKALVEKAVQIIETWIIAKLRHKQFTSLIELNQAIRKLLKEVNAKKLQKLTLSREELFHSIDKPALKPLPKNKYEYAQFKKMTVLKNYHIYVNQQYYSVPYRLVGKKVVVRISENLIEVYNNHICVARHKKGLEPGVTSTIKQHMPPAHLYQSQWSVNQFSHWAKSIGPETIKQTQGILAHVCHSERLYRIHNGLRRLEKEYGAQALEKACSYANKHELYGFRSIQSILSSGLYKQSHIESEDKDQKTFVPLNQHQHIRGKTYYQKQLGDDHYDSSMH